MIGLDTNVLVRYLTQDDPGQSATANEVIGSLTPREPGFLSLTTIVETHWVLCRAYGVSTTSSADIISRLLEVQELRVEHPDLVRAALACVDDGVDFADAVIGEAGRAAGCTETVTFDRRAARHDRMRLLET